MTSTSSRPDQEGRPPPRRRQRRPRTEDEGPEQLSPTRSLGQHFLHDANVIRRIVAAAELTGEETVVEVGPGTGALSHSLAQAAGRLILVEIDRRLAAKLREEFAANDRVSVIEADALAMTPDEMLVSAGLPRGSRYIVVSNLPYNAGAAILRHFLEAANPPRRLIVMLQREVAASLAAGPGELGLLAIGVQVYAVPRRLFNVAPGAFNPPPKVVSTVLRLDVREQPLVPEHERARFFALVRAGFNAPRKQVRNSLAQGLGRDPSQVDEALRRAGVDPGVRPDKLSIEDWLRLTRSLPLAEEQAVGQSGRGRHE